MEVETDSGRKTSENDPIWLNVGGETFCASLETLTWHPGTFFTGLFREDGVGIKERMSFLSYFQFQKQRRKKTILVHMIHFFSRLNNKKCRN